MLHGFVCSQVWGLRSFPVTETAAPERSHFGGSRVLAVALDTCLEQGRGRRGVGGFLATSPTCTGVECLPWVRREADGSR